jgi:hypothetical protein
MRKGGEEEDQMWIKWKRGNRSEAESRLSIAANNAETMGTSIGDDSDSRGIVKTQWEPDEDELRT